MNQAPAAPGPSGLYDPTNERDACGVALVAKLWGEATHAVIEKGLEALGNLEHRGAAGADPNTGDGAGILLQIPDAFFRGVAAGVELPPYGRYAVGVVFLPTEHERRAAARAADREHGPGRGPAGDLVARRADRRSLRGRDRPGFAALHPPGTCSLPPTTSPTRTPSSASCIVIRRLIELEAGDEVAIASFSSRTLVYKGMLTAPQLPRYFTDLRDPRLASRLALVHSRFQHQHLPELDARAPVPDDRPQRGDQHASRQRQLDAARESQLASELFGDDLARVMPVIQPEASDSAAFDNVLELLVLSGRSIPHAMMMMIPEAYRTRRDLDPDVKGFYDFHSCLMEPWDGPAAVVFTDGRSPARRSIATACGRGAGSRTPRATWCSPSEAGVLTVAPEHIQRKGRLAPGKMFLLDLEQGKIVDDEEVKRQVARRRPYGDWYQEAVVHIDDLPEREPRTPRIEPLRSKQLAFGYSQEDLRLVIAPMAAKAEEPVASMGNDAALAVLSDRQPPLFSYFKQLFAQVTNPPIDPIREQVVMSLQVGVGRERNLLSEVPGAGPPAGHGPADSAQPRAGEAAPGLARGVRRRDARHHLADRARAGRHASAARRAL